jgi:hypothetical protein
LRALIAAQVGWLLLALSLPGCSKTNREPGSGATSQADASNPTGSAHDRDAATRPFDNPAAALDAGPPSDAAATSAEYLLTPESPTLAIEHGSAAVSVQFEVKTRSGVHTDARFELADEALGTIDQDGLFTANGKRAGMILVEAHVGDQVVRTALTVTIHWEQNGGIADPASAQASGGYGGVGGDGPGSAVNDPLKKTLDGKPKPDAALRFLYPYDLTVFPLGMLAPLLMWSEASAPAADGILLQISTQNFEYRGYFGRPSSLAQAAPFVRHPIPQDVWDAATRSAAGGACKVELMLAKDGVSYGPISVTLKIAPGTLKGTVYYQSYGTNLAKNHDGAKGGDGRFGGATLAIKPGALGPELVAGSTGDHTQCRVCHSVSSDGSRMTVQSGGQTDSDYDATSSYDLKNGNTEMPYPGIPKKLAWIGLTPDGAYGLGNGYPLGVGGDFMTQLYDMTNGQVVPTTGLAGIVTEAAFPMFSHDGKRVAFNFYMGPGNATTGAADQKKLIGMDFDPLTKVFSNAQVWYQGSKPAGWPAFSPTGTSVMYQIEIKRGSENGFFRTRWGGQGELWWTNLETGLAHKLEQANGTQMGASYLPQTKDNHQTDELLNYEPTLAPIASGGYAWMVFTSRRLYGNVATIDPWFSDPREHDLTKTPTTKKLWVAAIDLDVHTPELNVQVGDDPSHPAFYLPGQELLAGNTRGFWAVDPCKADNKGCESGVECCSGFCQKEPTGSYTCGRKKYQCAREFDHCETVKDCCDPTSACVNHVCTKLRPD